MPTTKRARTTDEMRFAAELEPCPSCGTHELGTLELTGEGQLWRYSGACPRCWQQRTFEFATMGDPRTARAGRFELGEGESELITAEQFLAVIDEAAPKIPADPTALSAEERQAARHLLERSFTSIRELLCVVPVGTALMPGTTDARLTRPWCEKEYTRLRKLVSRYRPASTISHDALEAHVEWLRRGGKGEGYLSIEGRRMVDEFYGPINLTFASIVNSDLTNVDLGYAIFDEAILDGVVFTNAILNGASFTNAVIKGGTWTRAHLSIAKFNAAEITGTDFSQANPERSHWYNAKVRGARFDTARFGNAVFDRARFEGCSFHQATFHTIMPDPQPTSRGTQFINCDFTGVDLSERDLSETAFVRCKLAGTQGPQQSPEGLVLQDCDLDLETFLGRSH